MFVLNNNGSKSICIDSIVLQSFNRCNRNGQFSEIAYVPQVPFFHERVFHFNVLLAIRVLMKLFHRKHRIIGYLRDSLPDICNPAKNPCCTGSVYGISTYY